MIYEIVRPSRNRGPNPIPGQIARATSRVIMHAVVFFRGFRLFVAHRKLRQIKWATHVLVQIWFQTDFTPFCVCALNDFTSHLDIVDFVEVHTLSTCIIHMPLIVSIRIWLVICNVWNSQQHRMQSP